MCIRVRGGAVMTNTPSHTHEHLLGLISDNCPDLIALLDANGCFVYSNTAHFIRLGRDPESLIGTAVFELLHPEDTVDFEKAIYNSSRRRPVFHASARWIQDTGRSATFQSVGKWIPADGGKSQYLLLCSREVVETVRSQNDREDNAFAPEVRMEALRLLGRVEGEKNHVARAIHDDLGQKLTALTLELSLWKAELDIGQSKSVNAIREKIAVLTELANGMIAFTRNVTSTLRPRVLEEFGLVAALEWHVEKVQKQTGMACAFSAAPARLETEGFLASQIFKVAEEVIQLRVRAGCKSLHLRLLAQDEIVALVFEDSSKERQITPEVAARVRLLGGEIEINPNEKSILIAFPFSPTSPLLNKAVL
jgi:PAS domain S-box-containing protein